MRLDPPAKNDETKFNSFLLKCKNNPSNVMAPKPRLFPLSLSLIGRPHQVPPRLIMSLAACCLDCLMKYECNKQARLKVKISGDMGSSAAVTQRVLAAGTQIRRSQLSEQTQRGWEWWGRGGTHHSFIPKCYFYANERGRN